MAKIMDFKTDEQLAEEYKDSVDDFPQSEKVVSRTMEMYDLNRVAFKVSCLTIITSRLKQL